RIETGHPGVGDPTLDAVEHPVISVTYCPRRHGRYVRAGLGLRQAVGEEGFTARDRWQELTLELLGATEQQRERAELVHRRDQGRRGADPRHLFDHDHGGEGVRPRTAVLGGDVRGMEVGGLQGFVRSLWELPVLIRVPGVKCYLVLTNFTYGRTDLLVFGRHVIKAACRHSHSQFCLSADECEDTGGLPALSAWA